MKRGVAIVIGVTLLGTLGWGGLAIAQENVHSGHSGDPAAIAAYWTPQRMEAALPMDLPLEGKPQPPVSGAPVPTGSPGAIEASGGGQWQLVTADEATLLELARTEDLPTGYSYPPPENTWPVPVAWYGSFPLRTVGKAYFTQGGINYAGSGASNGNRAAITSGQIVSDGAGHWSTNVQFIPAMRGSWHPYGTWYQADLWTRSEWFSNSNWCRNVGFIIVGNQGGQTLEQKVGALGFAFNAGMPRAWTALGYPMDSPWSGSIIVATNASYSTSDSPGGCTPATVGIGTRQTGGCQGGPWIWNYRAQQFNNNFANGVFGHYYGGSPYEFFSPYFDDAIHSLYLDAVND